MNNRGNDNDDRNFNDDINNSLSNIGQHVKNTGENVLKKHRKLDSAFKAMMRGIKKAVKWAVRGLLHLIGSALVAILPYIIPILIGIAGILAIVGGISVLGSYFNQTEYQTKFVTSNYQEDSRLQDNMLKTAKNGYLSLNGKKAESNGNKMYFVYYSMNAPHSHWYVFTDSNGHLMHHKVKLNDGTYVNPEVRGDSPEAQTIEDEYSTDNNGSSLFGYTEKMSLSTNLLYLLDNTMNHSELGVGRQGFYFTEQFVRPVHMDQDGNYLPLTKRLPLKGNDKDRYAAYEREYQQWLQSNDDNYQKSKGAKTKHAKDKKKSSSTSSKVGKSTVDANKFDKLGDHGFKYKQTDIDSNDLTALSNQFDEFYNPKYEKVAGHKILMRNNSNHPHAYQYDDNGNVKRVRGVWNYGFGSVIKLRKIQYQIYDKNVKTYKSKSDGKTVVHKETNWVRKPDRTKLILSGINVPVGTVDLSNEINKKQAKLESYANNHQFNKLHQVEDDYTTLPDVKFDVAPKDSKFYGLDYFKDYLENYTIYVPNYVKHNIDLSKRWSQMVAGSKSANKTKKAIYKRLIAMSNKERDAEQSRATPSTKSDGKMYKGTHGGISFLGGGGDEGSIQAAFKFMPIVQKYCTQFGVDPYLVLAHIATESSGRVGADNGSAFGLGQIMLFGGSRTITTTDVKGHTETLHYDRSANADEQVKAAVMYEAWTPTLLGAYKDKIRSPIYDPAAYISPAASQSMFNVLGANPDPMKANDYIKEHAGNSNYIEKILGYYVGKGQPWIRVGNRKYSLSGNSSGEIMEGVAAGSVDDQDSGGLFSFMLKSFRSVATGLFGDSPLDANGVDIWSTTKVPEFKNESKYLWQPSVDHYSWDKYTMNLSDDQVLDLGREWMMDLMTADGKTTYFDETPESYYFVGRWLDDYTIYQFQQAEKAAEDGEDNSNDDEGSGSIKDIGSPIKGASIDSLGISSGFGWRNLGGENFHQGYDIDAANGRGDAGMTIQAVADGEIVNTGSYPSQGNLALEYFPKENIAVYYQHMAKILAHKGKIKKGDPVGIVGDTGSAGAFHLHITFFKNAKKYVFRSGYPMPSLSLPDRNDFVSPAQFFGLDSKADKWIHDSSGTPGPTIGDAKKHG